MWSNFLKELCLESLTLTVGKLWRPGEEEEAMQIGGIGAMLNIQFGAHTQTHNTQRHTKCKWEGLAQFSIFGYISVSINDLLG